MRKWWGYHFLFAEMLIAVAVGIVFALWQSDLGGAGVVDAIIKSNQSAVYGALATIWGALLGFAITSTSIILSYGDSPRMRPVTSARSYRDLGNVLRAVNPALALATLAALAALLVDRDASPSTLMRDLVVTTSLVAIATLGRTIWILNNIIRIATGASRARMGDEP